MIHELHLGCGELRLWVSGSFKDSFYGVPLRVSCKGCFKGSCKGCFKGSCEGSTGLRAVLRFETFTRYANDMC